MYEDDPDAITCKRCGANGLYWQDTVKPDGTVGHALFRLDNHRRHVCPGRQVDESMFPEGE